MAKIKSQPDVYGESLTRYFPKRGKKLSFEVSGWLKVVRVLQMDTMVISLNQP